MPIIEHILRSLFSFIDVLIAWGIEKSYLLITEVSTLMISSGIIKDFSSRISIFLGLFMLFWLAMRTISYIVEPDKFTDQKQGFSKVIMNVVLMLAMLALYNYVFTFAYKVQDELLSMHNGSNTLLKLVFGNTFVSNSGTEEEIAYKLPLYLYSAFLTPNEDTGGMRVCRDLLQKTQSDNVETEIQPCYDRLNKIDPLVASDVFNGYMSEGGVSRLYSLDVVTAKDGGEFIFTYRFLISTICGAIMLVVVVSTALEMSIRIFKFGNLQLIAPITIISFIDPKSGSEGIFKKWLQACISTYAGIFVKLFSIYFAVYMIMLIGTADKNITTIGGEQFDFSNPFVNVLLILGALQFAKQFPKLINEIFGVELGGGTFSSVAKTGKKASLIAGGAALGAAGGFVGGLAGGAKAGIGLRGVLGGAVGGTFAGAKAGSGMKFGTPFGKGMHASYKHVTGNDMNHFNAFQYVGRGAAKNKVEDIGSDKKYLQSELNDVSLQKQVAAKNYNDASFKYNESKAKYERAAEGSSVKTRFKNEMANYEQIMNNTKAEYERLLADEATISKHLSTLGDEIGDYKKHYNLDSSTTSNVKEAREFAANRRKEAAEKKANQNNNNNNMNK